MSLMGTLAKMAVGVAVAKGVGALTNKSNSAPSDGGLLGSLLGGQASSGGGLESMLGGLLGGGQSQSGGLTGGLGGLLDGLSDASNPNGAVQSSRGAASGGLDSLLNGLAGNSGQGGLADMLGGLTKGGGGDLGGLLGGLAQGGGLGGLLGGLMGAKSALTSAPDDASFGVKFNQALMQDGEPEVAPNAQQEFAAGIMLRAMIQAAKSDGKIDDSEREKLLGKLGDVSPQERDFVNAELAAQMDVTGLADQVPNGMEAQVYTMSVMGIDLDSKAEAQYLHDFATALGIDQNGVNQIHAQLGVPSIYA